MNEVTKKIRNAVDLVLDSNTISYIEIRFFRDEYQKVWRILEQQHIFDIEYIHVKVMVDTEKCVLVIGAGDIL